MTRTRLLLGTKAARPGRDREALGRSRGGLTTKIHLLADTSCRPLVRVTSAGQRHDSLALQPLLARLRITRRGTGQPADPARPGCWPTRPTPAKLPAPTCANGTSKGLSIPRSADQIANRRRRGKRGGRPPSFDAELYKQRNTVERAISKLRQHRAVATRYDKRDFVYRGTVDVAAIRIWLRDPSHDLRDTP